MAVRQIEPIDRAELRATIQKWIDAHTDVDDTDGVGLLEDVLWEINAQPTLTPPNEPLTLDELGEMSYTDWVWLEFPGEKPSDNCWERGWKAYRLYSHERYGVSWLAYRRPPEGEEDT